MDRRLKNIKAVFADVDNTLLCLKMYDNDGKRTVGFKEYVDWLKFNIFNNAYIDCVAPKGMFNLITELNAEIASLKFPISL